MKLKVSEYLVRLDARTAYQSRELKREFQEATGDPAPDWMEYGSAAVVGDLQDDMLAGEMYSYGDDVAIALAERYAPQYQKTKFGRNAMFREALEALVAAGR